MRALPLKPPSGSLYSAYRISPRRRKAFIPFVFFSLSFLTAIIPRPPAFAATSANQPRASAAGINGADAQLNGVRMVSGATLFPGDVVTLGAASSVALQFGKSLVLAAPQTAFVVDSEGVNLRSGRLQVRSANGYTFPVSGPYFHVNVVSSASAAGSADIQVNGKEANVSVVSGIAAIAAEGIDIPYELHAGETATLDADGALPAQGAATPAAGQVSRLLPQVQIDRASQQMVAAISAPVFWNDDLRSGPTGRAHVTLTDGSQLYLGSNSTMRVLQHDAQAQQTSLDLLIGRLRGLVVKLSRPGSNFEIRTPVGVAGLVGTDFSLEVTPDYVELMVFEGAVRFTIFSSGRAILVPAGMKLRISRTGNSDGPQIATPLEIQTAKDLTAIPAITVQNAQADRKNKPLAPILISISTGTATIGIGTWLAKREYISPILPQ
jgi:hypothetical protein